MMRRDRALNYMQISLSRKIHSKIKRNIKKNAEISVDSKKRMLKCTTGIGHDKSTHKTHVPKNRCSNRNMQLLVVIVAMTSVASLWSSALLDFLTVFQEACIECWYFFFGLANVAQFNQIAYISSFNQLHTMRSINDVSEKLTTRWQHPLCDGNRVRATY